MFYVFAISVYTCFSLCAALVTIKNKQLRSRGSHELLGRVHGPGLEI